MNWDVIGWGVLAASGLVIVVGSFACRRTVQLQPAGKLLPLPELPVRGLLEIAWPVFFLAAMAMLTFKEVIPFPAVLLLMSSLTGAIWAVDHFLLRPRRADAAESPLVEMAHSFFPVLLVIFFLRSFLYEPFKIPSESMLPTLHVGDFILVNKFTYGVRLPVINHKLSDGTGPQRGDVMVFRLPENPAKDLIKRVVGLPGDKVVYRNKQLTINDQPVEQQRTGAVTMVDEQLGLRRYDAVQEKLGGKAHTVLVNPDVPGVYAAGVRNFPQRDQCRYQADGFVCTVPAGHYFMMGDNRDNSDDSRYWGFVPDENIVGKAVAIWMNFGEFKRIGSAIE